MSNISANRNKPGGVAGKNGRSPHYERVNEDSASSDEDLYILEEKNENQDENENKDDLFDDSERAPPTSLKRRRPSNDGTLPEPIHTGHPQDNFKHSPYPVNEATSPGKSKQRNGHKVIALGTQRNIDEELNLSASESSPWPDSTEQTEHASPALGAVSPSFTDNSGLTEANGNYPAHQPKHSNLHWTSEGSKPISPLATNDDSSKSNPDLETECKDVLSSPATLPLNNHHHLGPDSNEKPIRSAANNAHSPEFTYIPHVQVATKSPLSESSDSVTCPRERSDGYINGELDNHVSNINLPHVHEIISPKSANVVSDISRLNEKPRLHHQPAGSRHPQQAFENKDSACPNYHTHSTDTPSPLSSDKKAVEGFNTPTDKTNTQHNEVVRDGPGYSYDPTRTGQPRTSPQNIEPDSTTIFQSSLLNSPSLKSEDNKSSRLPPNAQPIVTSTSSSIPNAQVPLTDNLSPTSLGGEFQSDTQPDIGSEHSPLTNSSSFDQDCSEDTVETPSDENTLLLHSKHSDRDHTLAEPINLNRNSSATTESKTPKHNTKSKGSKSEGPEDREMTDPVTVTRYSPKLQSDGDEDDHHMNGLKNDRTDYQKAVTVSTNGDALGSRGANKVGDISDEDDGGPCGWGKFQIGFCQRFRDPRWFLVIITMCGAVQGMAINGFVNTVISTIERRFEINSTESGLIASCYDIMFVLLVIPISYFGGHGNKPRYLGIGIFVLGIGSFVFSLPHFISEAYTVENAQEVVCSVEGNMSSTCLDDQGSSLSNYKYFFFLGQLLHGAGATPLYTLGVVYLDENVPQRSSSFYNGIFYTGAIIGPALGYMVGSEFLNIYTELGVDPDSLGLDTNNPKWVGAWWIGFLISGTIAVLISLPLLAFPASLPGSKKYALERGQETQASKVADVTGQQRGFRDILLSLKYLVTNIPFMFINLAAAADGILVAGFSTFMPKFIEYQFGVSAGTAALYVGLAVVPAGGGATFGGGFIVRFFNLKVRGILRLCIISSLILTALSLAILMECDIAPFAGVTLPYGETNVKDTTFLGKSLTHSCNQNCSCAEEDYFPMCGRDKVMYFSPCYAGCTDVFLDGDVKRYANCSCINYNQTADDISKGHLYEGEFGKCEFECHWLSLFVALFGVMIVFVFITSMPSLTATLRCVPDHQRSFGLGIQWIVARCLGSIPGPILFGKMFDLACLVWQKRCNGDGSCFFYDNHQMSLNLMALAVVFCIVAFLSFLAAYLFYKAKDTDDDDQSMEMSINSSRNELVPNSKEKDKHNKNSDGYKIDEGNGTTPHMENGQGIRL